MLLRRVLMIVLSLALVGAMSACGNKTDKTLTASTEGPYIDLGDLQYQVQISRQLNPVRCSGVPQLTNHAARTSSK